MSVTLWVIQGTAEASEGCDYPKGEKHAFIGFITDPDRDLASDRLAEELTTIGWRNLFLSRSGTINSDLTTVKKDVLREAARRALETGWGVVFYSDPIETEDNGKRQ